MAKASDRDSAPRTGINGLLTAIVAEILTANRLALRTGGDLMSVEAYLHYIVPAV